MNEKIYYVYRHVRLDTNEVFYVGKGTANLKGKSESVFYSRAFCKTQNGRNSWWHKITSKTKYSIEIIFQHSNQKTIESKEREFIRLYGRKDLKKGTLINFSDGGEGSSNQRMTAETKVKMSSNAKNRRGEKAARNLPVFVYRLDGSFYKSFFSRMEASKQLNIHHGNIAKVLGGWLQYSNDWIFKKEYMGDFIEPNIKKRYDHRDVYCFNKDKQLIRNFDSIELAALFFKSSYKTIYAACSARRRHKGHFLSFSKTLF